jgi:small GTP-binding protein
MDHNILRKKVLMVGDSGCGKTSLLARYADAYFNPTFISTIGIDFKVRTVERNGHKVRLQIWDTAGQERFNTITSSYYRGSHCIILVFSLTDHQSFKNLGKWTASVNTHVESSTYIILTGTKADDINHRCVSQEEIDEFAKKNNLLYIETSALTGTGVHELFESIVDRLIETHPMKTTSVVTGTVSVTQPVEAPAPKNTGSLFRCVI